MANQRAAMKTSVLQLSVLVLVLAVVTVSASPVPIFDNMRTVCVHNGETYPPNVRVPTDDPCEECWCILGHVRCYRISNCHN